VTVANWFSVPSVVHGKHGRMVFARQIKATFKGTYAVHVAFVFLKMFSPNHFIRHLVKVLLAKSALYPKPMGK
jgi:hypothetical protein